MINLLPIRRDLNVANSKEKLYERKPKSDNGALKKEKCFDFNVNKFATINAATL